MDDFTAEAIRLSLQRMFRADRHFSICDLETCLDAAGIPRPPHKEWQALRALHCVSWSDMSPEMREATFRRVARLFQFPDMRFEELEQSVLGSPGSSSLFQKLLGRGKADA